MEEHNDKPPVFRSWAAWYWLVALFLIVQIVLFVFFTNYFS